MTEKEKAVYIYVVGIISAVVLILIFTFPERFWWLLFVVGIPLVITEITFQSEMHKEKQGLDRGRCGRCR